MAERHSLPTLHGAAFLACIELAAAEGEGSSEFRTADRELVRMLGDDRPAYVKELR